MGLARAAVRPRCGVPPRRGDVHGIDCRGSRGWLPVSESLRLTQAGRLGSEFGLAVRGSATSRLSCDLHRDGRFPGRGAPSDAGDLPDSD